MDISIPYYEDLTRLSNSNIGWFLDKGPAFLHKMLSGEVKSESTSAMTRGTMIHEYLLQPEEFQKDYVVWDKSRPSSANEEKFCQAYANSLEIEPDKALIEAYKIAYSVAGKSDDKILSEAQKKASILKDYISFLKSHDKRTMISIWDMKMLQTIATNIDNHKAARKLLQPVSTSETYEVHHEFHINWECFVQNVDGDNDTDYCRCLCKSLLDSVTFDFVKKEVTLMDLKTTSHIQHFETAVDTYDYTRQLWYYTMSIKWYLENERNENLKEWKFKCAIIAIDTVTADHRIRVFGFVQPILRYRSDEKIRNAIRDIMWHKRHNLWEHSRAYYESDGIETLELS